MSPPLTWAGIRTHRNTQIRIWLLRHRDTQHLASWHEDACQDIVRHLTQIMKWHWSGSRPPGGRSVAVQGQHREPPVEWNEPCQETVIDKLHKLLTTEGWVHTNFSRYVLCLKYFNFVRVGTSGWAILIVSLSHYSHITLPPLYLCLAVYYIPPITVKRVFYLYLVKTKY